MDRAYQGTQPKVVVGNVVSLACEEAGHVIPNWILLTIWHHLASSYITSHDIFGRKDQVWLLLTGDLVFLLSEF